MLAENCTLWVACGFNLVMVDVSWSLKTTTTSNQIVGFLKRGKSKLVYRVHEQCIDICDPAVKETVISHCRVKTAVFLQLLSICQPTQT